MLKEVHNAYTLTYAIYAFWYIKDNIIQLCLIFFLYQCDDLHCAAGSICKNQCSKNGMSFGCTGTVDY